MKIDKEWIPFLPHIKDRLTAIEQHKAWMKANPEDKEGLKHRKKLIAAEKEGIEMGIFIRRLNEAIDETNKEWNEKYGN
ncbi:hypothetical protein FT641_20170 [Bacillus paranthracis]|uniref:hypothetical protein n=1 Tax=Bacillus paranthracis TaxID=2026186 RepID=UPI00187AB313|nr:hypothetical protein [Bacillus paranthracis]MBE7114621.1 hypothetical protein [Bacillus paranthracis]MBE7155012.1 hypothetical protein [Bacillus paranthracis]